MISPLFQSAFIPNTLVDRVRRNAQTDDWCADAARKLIAKAAPWHALADTELWNLMFGPTITRSRVVDADGYCPVCRTAVPMYSWQLDVVRMPWKVACPHCNEQFPKNDFHAYYRSGLDDHGVFDPQLPDRRLLVNAEHPDPADPLHQFGVDDGTGYSDGTRRWWFASTYLLCGQWRLAVLTGIEALSTAYVLTGDGSYARQAAILIDRVADLYPLFNYRTQAQQANTNGAVDNWHDANRDMFLLALAYDRIRAVLPSDLALVDFLSAQARRYHLDNRKTHWAEIRRNIEDRLFREALLVHPERVISNYPRGEILRAVLIEILGEPGSEKLLQEMLLAMVDRATHVDGVTGEKGLPSYCAYTIAGLADYLALLSRRDPALLPKLLQQQPRLQQTYRFHAETLCLQRFQPNIGDAAGIGMPVTSFGVFFGKEPGLNPSQFTFMMELYRATKDPVYLQMLQMANQADPIPAWIGSQSLHQPPTPSTGLPYDLFAEDPTAFRQEVAAQLARVGTEIKVGSINKEAWAVAILRSGTGDRARALWLDYDMGGSHSHADAMNLGFYALGLDLLPDFGYPQIQYQGWDSPKGRWFITTAAHNTVVVDGRDQGHYYKHPASGRTSLWVTGSVLQAIRTGLVAGPDPLPPLCGCGEKYIAFYAYRPGRFRAVQVFIRDPKTANWSRAFTDDFQRTELGPDWKILEGEWRIESGWLVGQGKLLCNRQFAGAQRLDYEAQAGCDQPCDLSALLSSNPSGEGVFYGFGSNNNQGSKLLFPTALPVAAESPVRIVPGQIHQVSCRCDPQHLQMWLDGSVALDCDHVQNVALRQVFGDEGGAKQFERTALLVEISPADAYVVDVFRVVGGSDHARFFHSSFGTVKIDGPTLVPGVGFAKGVLVRNVQTDPHPPSGWRATWAIEDHYRLLPAGSEVHLRHTDLTRGAAAVVGESWVNAGNFNTADEQWIPTLITRNQGAAPLTTTFVAVLEPFAASSAIHSIRRLDLNSVDGVCADSVVAIEVKLADGRQDLIIATDPHGPTCPAGPVRQADWKVLTDADLVLIRRDATGRPEHVALGGGSFVEIGSIRIEQSPGRSYTESKCT